MPTWKQLKDNPKLWDIFYLRQKIIIAIREFFQKQDFLELFTPILQPSVIPEPYHDLFSTTLMDKNQKRKKLFLIPSPEVSIKKMLAAGLPKCFEIARCFRNGETSDSHNFEFSSLEWYRTNANYMNILEDCQKLILYIARKINKNKILIYQGNKIDLSLPWEKMSVSQALKKYAGIDFDDLFPVKKIVKIAQQKGYRVNSNNTWEEIFNQIYLNEIEPNFKNFLKPTIIYDYPAPMAALAKLKENDNRLCERFEIYMGALELADCCTELTDYDEQRIRFKKNMDEISNSGKNQIIPDSDFLEAIKSGLPACSGIALGIDRLVMLFGDKKKISDTILNIV